MHVLLSIMLGPWAFIAQGQIYAAFSQYILRLQSVYHVCESRGALIVYLIVMLQHDEQWRRAAVGPGYQREPLDEALFEYDEALNTARRSGSKSGNASPLPSPGP